MTNISITSQCFEFGSSSCKITDNVDIAGLKNFNDFAGNAGLMQVIDRTRSTNAGNTVDRTRRTTAGNR